MLKFTAITKIKFSTHADGTTTVQLQKKHKAQPILSEYYLCFVLLVGIKRECMVPKYTQQYLHRNDKESKLPIACINQDLHETKHILLEREKLMLPATS